METEASPFESSEMLATFLASTPLLSNSWKLCDSANSLFHHGFLSEQIGSVGYVAFSGVQPTDCSFYGRNLEVLHSGWNCNGVFSCLQHRNDEREEEPVMVHGGFLRVFLSSFYADPSFQYQVSGIVDKSKSIVITGHSAGGTIASLCALWLLCYLETQSISNISVLCITFGSTLLGNESLSRAILRQRWTGNFCHLVSKHDIVPRLLFAPLPRLIPHLDSLVQFWQLSMTSTHFGSFSAELSAQTMADIFRIVFASLQEFIQQAEGVTKMESAFWPFGNYIFCSQDGAICVDNAVSVVKMMHLLFSTTSPSSSIEDHLKYEDYVSQISFEFLNKRSFLPDDDFPQSSYEAGVSLALQSSGIASQDPVAQPAKDCLKLARPMGRTPSLNCANLAIKLSKITPYRAEIQWYKACCDESDDQLGYYDSFKQRGASKRDYKVNMNRHKLNQFWDNVINMLENNQLPADFHSRAKWINASQFYKLLVEPLDIAEYYRTGMHLSKGHYISNGRERRYKIFDRWWNGRTVKEEENNTRSKFASLTQDTCFWAKVEEARECLDNLRSETDPRNQAILREKIDEFERYARELVERKEVSKDVLAKNSSYCLWVKDYEFLKSQVGQIRPQFPSFMDGEVVP